MLCRAVGVRVGRILGADHQRLARIEGVAAVGAGAAAAQFGQLPGQDLLPLIPSFANITTARVARDRILYLRLAAIDVVAERLRIACAAAAARSENARIQQERTCAGSEGIGLA
jgi:hypothetical protein